LISFELFSWPVLQNQIKQRHTILGIWCLSLAIQNTDENKVISKGII